MGGTERGGTRRFGEVPSIIDFAAYMKRVALLAQLVALLPAGVAAQGVTITPFAASDGGLPGSPALVGISATTWTGPVGLRLGGAMDMASSPIGSLFGQTRPDVVEAWQGDLDLVFDLGRAGLQIRSVDPRLFAGFGVHGRRQGDASGATIPVWSYGAAGAVSLTRWLALDLEARYRMPHESDASALPAGVGGGWETRGGLAFRIGGGRAAPARPASPRAEPRAGGGGVYSGGAVRDAGAAGIARGAIRTAERYVGLPYVWGGTSPSEGFDCSGFVHYVFREHGIRLPRVSRDQANAGAWLPPRVDGLAPGDLMFYAGRDGVIDHVAIYAGGGRIIHASSTGRGVRYDDLNTQRGHYYATRMVAARRVIPDGGGFVRLH
jgi:cell wall-associated NlpC family hydrolase